MTVDESISIIIKQLLEGVMLHTQLCHYFYFLGLKGYAECQKYHYYDESASYMDLCKYYICHYHKLIAENNLENKNIVPNDWYNFTQFDVNITIRKTSIKTGIEQWVKWEKETKALLQQHYQNLINSNEIAFAEKLSEKIKHVDEELSKAEEILLTLQAIDFNISDIMPEQDELYEKYKKKIKEVKLL